MAERLLVEEVAALNVAYFVKRLRREGRWGTREKRDASWNDRAAPRGGGQVGSGTCEVGGGDLRSEGMARSGDRAITQVGGGRLEGGGVWGQDIGWRGVVAWSEMGRPLWDGGVRVEVFLDAGEEWRARLGWWWHRGEWTTQTMRLLTTRPNYGGVRWWWECCKQRVRTLYFRHGGWGCRECQELVYRSSREAHAGERRAARKRKERREAARASRFSALLAFSELLKRNFEEE